MVESINELLRKQLEINRIVLVATSAIALYGHHGYESSPEYWMALSSNFPMAPSKNS